jgi:hypothetical protein
MRLPSDALKRLQQSPDYSAVLDYLENLKLGYLADIAEDPGSVSPAYMIAALDKVKCILTPYGDPNERTRR